MGAFAEAHLAGMTDAELRAYERVLNAETIDLYNFVTGRSDAPANLDPAVMARIKAFVNTSPLGRADPAAYEKVKGIYSN